MDKLQQLELWMQSHHFLGGLFAGLTALVLLAIFLLVQARNKC